MKSNMIFKLKVTIFFILTSITGSCQKYGDLVKVNQLSTSIQEISGIAKISQDQLIYAINDSGNDNILYGLDATGTIVKEIKLTNTTNIDWEAMASDKDGNVYVGDFGNNKNDRKDLVIYKVSEVFAKKTGNATAIKTTFVFEDQEKFPPKKEKRNFDVEAFIYLNNNFYLFTKNRAKKFDGVTKLYKIPAAPGDYVAKLIGSYETCNDDNDCFVTGAAINTENDKIVLLTYDKLFIFKNFKNDNFFEGDVEKIQLEHRSQKEGVCFKNKNTLFIIDEGRGQSGGNLYEYPLK
ncbi:hypothetical protein ACE939_08010 [Aquimarina sp. W85]|uniref:hypothetical protein n=1 Tax=Aquimarina rhodophyticola TaxID=3342246 RepID=UPI00366EFBE0